MTNRQVLLPLEEAVYHPQSMAYALWTAAKLKAELVVLRVHQHQKAGSTSDQIVQYMDEKSSSLKQDVNNLVALLKDQGFDTDVLDQVRIKTKVALGRISNEVNGMVKQGRIAMIVQPIISKYDAEVEFNAPVLQFFMKKTSVPRLLVHDELEFEPPTQMAYLLDLQTRLDYSPSLGVAKDISSLSGLKLDLMNIKPFGHVMKDNEESKEVAKHLAEVHPDSISMKTGRGNTFVESMGGLMDQRENYLVLINQSDVKWLDTFFSVESQLNKYPLMVMPAAQEIDAQVNRVA